MSKKMPLHYRTWKKWKAGYFKKLPMSVEERRLLEKHYSFAFADELKLNVTYKTQTGFDTVIITINKKSQYEVSEIDLKLLMPDNCIEIMDWSEVVDS